MMKMTTTNAIFYVSLCFLCLWRYTEAMRPMTPTPTIEADADQSLTTGEAARILNCSRQHVVDLCNRG